MPLRLSRVTSTTDFEEITRVQFLAYRDPWIPLLQLFFPVADSSPDAYEAAIKDATRRITEWHQSDPTSTWLKVTDDATGRIAGAACWHMYDHDPYTTYPDIDCYWWPKGEDRKVANALMLLDNCFTHPEFRRRGVATLLIDWGIRQADAQGLGTYVDASDMGLQFYRRRWGFVADEQRELTMAGLPVTPRRVELGKQLLPSGWWPCYRPVGGKYEPERDALPWDKT
ncbi:uncharacterized protein UV8b_05991 [Ustilaginoidea virens]|uniref:N-acetyltransferase domain-containing protein n=1 Tax=Ustilaginoidea virens TaxID=1159556 RepID=A0A8E5HUG4_USTVR|nr:uncharacterized protein UV8b_05991 [Ustilaginoidea virens]QUC21748.1 hypothetical protein UV8b_05991 [Ustilaginoidea virens]